MIFKMGTAKARRQMYRDGESTLGRRRVTGYDAPQLRTMLLADHRRNRADSLQWVVAAVVRIAELEHKPIEDVWVDINGEAQAANGMPLSPYFA